MVKFNKRVNKAEVKTTYLNLTDDKKRTYGKYFPRHGTKLDIVDENNQRFNATKHHGNQIWGLRNWFKTKNITPGTLIQINY